MGVEKRQKHKGICTTNKVSLSQHNAAFKCISLKSYYVYVPCKEILYSIRGYVSVHVLKHYFAVYTGMKVHVCLIYMIWQTLYKDGRVYSIMAIISPG